MSVSFVVFLCWLAMGGICAYLAQKQGRNPFLWFFIGVFLGVLGILLLFFLPQKKEEKPNPTPVTAPAYQPFPTEEEASEEPSLSKKRLSQNPRIHWYFIDKNRSSQGPFKFDDIKVAYKEGVITPITLLWNEELEQWMPLKNFADYEFLLQE